MALTFDTANLVIESDASINDLPVFHAALRDWEDGEGGVIWPVTHSWKALDLGGGAYFYGLALLNGWQLKFPTPGNYTIKGNLSGTIIPVAGVYVERQTSAAYATTAIGGSGPTPEDIAAAVYTQSQATPLHVDMRKTHGYTIIGSGIPPTYANQPVPTDPGDPFRPEGT